MLTREIDKEEVRAALFQMQPGKAPGPDGFSPGFYQKFWDIVGDDVWLAVKSFLFSTEQMRKINNTYVCLIPKTKTPTHMTELRPISLCNVLYKIGSKVLANRLKPVMDGLISHHQSAFVPGRCISDNTILAYEILHYMRGKRTGGKGFCALKLDMSKAYDRVEWGFLEKMMTQLGFCDGWIQVIMRCISTVSYSFLINGQPRGCVIPGRGLRQGDALSPYLFLLCGELFSRLITEQEGLGKVGGVRICRQAPAISHLLFADDSLIFCRAESGDCATLQYIFKVYERTTGQQINFSKSAISFSTNTEVAEQERLAGMLGVAVTRTHESYLGLPLHFGRGRIQAFRFIVDRMKRRTRGWKERCLSIAGREVLIKSVLQAIPTYFMSCFEIPKSLCDEMHGIMARYWWGVTENKKKIHWVAWEKLCCAKKDGGMGFRNMRDFNIALLAKQAWRLHECPDSLLARVLRARYFPNGDLMEVNSKANSSLIWRSILLGRDSLRRGLRYQVGSGTTIRVWQDRWLDLPLHLKPFSPAPDDQLEMKVIDLMVDCSTSWDIPKLRLFFTEEEVKIIARVPISMRRVDDRLVWNYNKDGKFTVRSGYHIERTHRLCTNSASTSGGSSGCTMEQMWRRVWQAGVPNKIKIFIWRVLKGGVPTRERLHQRRCVQLEIQCLFCKGGIETIEHVLRDCVALKPLWGSCPFGEKLQVERRGSFADWMALCMESLSCMELDVLYACIWLTWYSRNAILWENETFVAGSIYQRANLIVGEFKRCHAKEMRKADRPIEKWQCPPSGRLKLNIDGAFDASSGRGGIGVIARDERGVGVAAVARPVMYASSALHMEVEACRTGLKLGLDQGWQHIEVESDSILLVSALKSGNMTMIEVGHLLGDCMELCKLYQSFHIGHVRREANNVADRLACLARDNVISNVWIEEMPECVRDVLYEDVSHLSSPAQGLASQHSLVQSCMHVVSNKNEMNAEL